MRQHKGRDSTVAAEAGERGVPMAIGGAQPRRGEHRTGPMRQHKMIDESAAVISGIGIVSPFGVGIAPYWQALCEGRSAIAEIRRFDPGRTPPRLGAEVADFPAREFLPPPLVRRMDRVSQMIGVASVLAAADAGLARTAEEDDFGVVVGAALGNLSESAQFLERVFAKGPSLANPMLFPNLVLNAPASQVAMALGWRGPNLTVAAGEIAGEAALDAALAIVRRGRARAVVVAAGEELSAIVFQALKDVGALSPERGRFGRERSAPFDVDVNGRVLGEGAAAVVVESAESARRRGAKSYASIARLERFTLPVPSPHHWPEVPIDDMPRELSTAEAEVFFSGADSSPERDRLELALLSAIAPPGRPLYALAGAVGTHGGQGLATIATAALALSSGCLPPIAGLERPRAEAPFELPRAALRGEWARAFVLGVARGGGGAAIELARGDRTT